MRGGVAAWRRAARQREGARARDGADALSGGGTGEAGSSRRVKLRRREGPGRLDPASGGRIRRAEAGYIERRQDSASEAGSVERWRDLASGGGIRREDDDDAWMGSVGSCMGLLGPSKVLNFFIFFSD